MAKVKNLIIEQGKTFKLIVRWENTKLIYKAITGISKTAPVRIDCVGHGVPDGWNVVVTSVKGMTQINPQNSPPKDKDYSPATPVSTDILEINSINAAEFSTYASGGYVQYYEPRPLSTATGRMKIKDKIGGTVLFELTTANGRIIIDNATKTITLLISAADTEIMTWVKGVYDLEIVEAGSPEVVHALLTGTVTVSKEVTTI